MTDKILMPKATATWLIDNTALTFKQIAEFCGLHILEIEGLADGETSDMVRALNPILNGQLTKEEIKRCEKDDGTSLKAKDLPDIIKKKNKKKGKKYTPLSKRQDKPDAIHFLLKKYPVLTDAQICKLIGTTKNTISTIRDKTHWKANSMENIDPVISGFCTQTELDAAVKKAEEKAGVQNSQNKTEEPDEGQILADADKFFNL